MYCQLERLQRDYRSTKNEYHVSQLFALILIMEMIYIIPIMLQDVALEYIVVLVVHYIECIY